MGGLPWLPSLETRFTGKYTGTMTGHLLGSSRRATGTKPPSSQSSPTDLDKGTCNPCHAMPDDGVIFVNVFRSPVGQVEIRTLPWYVSTDAIHTGTNAKCLCPWEMVSDLGYIEHCDSVGFDILSSLSSNLSSSSFPSTCHFGQKGFLPLSAPCISAPARCTTLILIFHFGRDSSLSRVSTHLDLVDLCFCN